MLRNQPNLSDLNSVIITYRASRDGTNLIPSKKWREKRIHLIWSDWNWVWKIFLWNRWYFFVKGEIYTENNLLPTNSEIRQCSQFLLGCLGPKACHSKTIQIWFLSICQQELIRIIPHLFWVSLPTALEKLPVLFCQLHSYKVDIRTWRCATSQALS